MESMYKHKMKTTNEKQEINFFSGEKQEEWTSKEFADKETQTDLGCFCQHFNTVKNINSEEIGNVIKDAGLVTKNAGKDANTDIKDKDTGLGNKPNSSYHNLGPVLQQESKNIEKETIIIDFTEEEPNIKNYMKNKHSQNLIKLTQDLELKPLIVKDNYKLNIPDKIKEEKNVSRVNNEKEEFNILVLGPSRVGKSTWINSLITYIKYDNMKLAQQNELIKQIPIQFTITDDNYDIKIISTGSDANENHDIGTSCTIDCRMYSLNYKNCKINVIDTPGIGDTAGIERDRINTEKILHFISFLNDVHAICVLLKPNESRIDTLFKFSSILGQLNKQAVSNLLFCFTNARSTLYKPGETMIILYTILEQMKLNFTMDFNRIYCVDNEAYRYLCTVNIDGINYSQQDVSYYDTSYNKSVQETKRMLDFILTLTPHKVNDTTILNNIRKTITYLLQPIVNAACNIEKHIASQSKNSREIIKTLIEPTESKLCCYSRYCLKHIRSSETGRVERKPEICFRRCIIEGAKYGHSEDKIQNRVYFNGRGNCKKCNCSWQHHKMVATEYKTIIEEIKEPGDTNFTDYKKCLITTSVKLTLFMKKHSVVYVDLIQDYLQDLIDTEMQKSALTSNQTVIETYKKTLYEYESELRKLKNIDDELTAENVLKWKQDIFSLPEFGETIKSSFEKYRENLYCGHSTNE